MDIEEGGKFGGVKVVDQGLAFEVVEGPGKEAGWADEDVWEGNDLDEFGYKG